MVRAEAEEGVRAKARESAERKLLDLLLKRPAFEEVSDAGAQETVSRRRQKLRAQLRAGALDSQEVTVAFTDRGGFTPLMQVFGSQGMEQMGVNLQEMFGNVLPRKQKERTLPVKDALRLLEEEEANRLVDNDRVTEEARQRVEQTGIIFIDEMDKIAGRESGHGPDVSREGVQRDLLPIVEGTTVSTKYGPVRTDHILFIAAGAFHVSKPSDLIPEMQGRFPIRVELNPLAAADFRRILTEPENSLIRQYTELLATERVQLEFTAAALEALADLAVKANERMENIGARRLYTLLEKLLEEVSFHAPDMPGTTVRFDRGEVLSTLDGIIENQDMSRYIL
jgi:ATP-dependent HslUV protease ATP-binding subunit HslU